MTDEEKKEKYKRENFLCRCGSTLVFEHRILPETENHQQTRVACYWIAQRKPNYHPLHDEPTRWCDTREEAQATWEMVNALTKSP